VTALGLALAVSAAARMPRPGPPTEVTPVSGVRIVSQHGYPELHVDGRPFFIHAASFPYYRIPEDLWDRSLDRYRDLGINTIDLRIPWNWHEPREGEVDFDGHTNLRRDLRGLLRMITEKGFRLIARPGPIIGDDWRNGGYPDWLLRNGDYKMPAVEQIAGFYPPAARIQASDAEAGAARWISNATHMRFAALWLGAVARELAQYSSTKSVTISPRPVHDGDPTEQKSSGPLLFVFLDDSAALDAAGHDPATYWKYINALQEALSAGGVQAPFVVTASHAENGFDHGASGSEVAIAGKWFLNPADRPPTENSKSNSLKLRDSDAQTLELLTQSLRTQPDFPAFLGDFQAGWLTAPDDAAPPRSSSYNTLLSSRWLMAQGAAGIEYSPLQDSLTPPGYQTAQANRAYRWDAALDLSGSRQARARAVERNANFLEPWSEFLASAHPRTSFALIDWRSGLSQAESLPPLSAESAAVESQSTLRQIERVAFFAGLPVELTDPSIQPVDSLLHEPVLLLVIPRALRGASFLPVKTQTALLEYVRRGGTLVCDPERPQGRLFVEALRDTTSTPLGEGMSTTKLGQGQLIEWSKDFYSWAEAGESFAASQARPQADEAIAELHNMVQQVGIHSPVIQSPGQTAALLVQELQPNESAGPLGALDETCAMRRPQCGKGLLSVTNWSNDTAVQETLKILPPNVNARGVSEPDYIELPVEIPAGESLMLPLNVPLCTEGAPAEACADRVVAAGAELLGSVREGKALTLSFYAPTSATIFIRLRSTPTRVDLPSMLQVVGKPKVERRPPRLPTSDISVVEPPAPLDSQTGSPFPERTLEGTYDKATGIFKVVLPRGAAPSFRRDMQIHLSYTPDAPERKKPAKRRGNGFRYSIPDAVRLPLGEGSSLPTVPPLILLNKDRIAQFSIDTENLNDSPLTVQASVDGVLHGSETLRMMELGDEIETIRMRTNGPADSVQSGLSEAKLTLSSDRPGMRSYPIKFLSADGDTPIHYEYDFERSGSANWVLENSRVRLIVLPIAGGQAVALVDKLSGYDLTTTVGGMRDFLRFPKSDQSMPQPTFDVPYAAEWQASKDDTAIRMTARWPIGIVNFGDVVKTIHMDGKDGRDTIQVEYEVGGASARSETGPDVEAAARPTLVMEYSVPASAAESEKTQFCWSGASEHQDSKTSAGSSAPSSVAKCVEFEPGGNPIVIPPGLSVLEVRNPGRPTLKMEWNSGGAGDFGSVTIEQKYYSSLILLEFPAAPGGGGAAHLVVRYTVVRQSQ
jgi:hypothetical protein